MIVITKDRKSIIECSELGLDGKEIVGFVMACPGCKFTAGVYDTEQEAESAFTRYALLRATNGVSVIDLSCS